MATKAQVIAKLKKQGAEWEIEDRQPFTFSAWLPAHLVWDNGNHNGMISEEKFDDETMAEYWDQIYRYINYPVIPKP